MGMCLDKVDSTQATQADAGGKDSEEEEEEGKPVTLRYVVCGYVVCEGMFHVRLCCV